jgi:hypothetical protein
VSVRKPEQGTLPQVFYIGADASTLEPTRSAASPSYAFSGRPDPLPITLDASLRPEDGRRVYDAPHLRVPWGPAVSLYLWTKSLAAGIGGVGAALLATGVIRPDGQASLLAAGFALAFLLATVALLVGDLKHPERVYLMFLRPQWRSWLVKGGIALTLYGVLLALWLVLALLGRALPTPLAFVTVAAAALSAGYSAFLFSQAEARDFWQSPLVLWHLLLQALVAGTAFLLVTGAGDPRTRALALPLFLAAVALHVAFALAEVLGRHATHEATLAADALRRGSLARLFWGGVTGVGGVLALAALALFAQSGLALAGILAAGLAVVGLLAYEHAWVQAGQSVPLS